MSGQDSLLELSEGTSPADSLGLPGEPHFRHLSSYLSQQQQETTHMPCRGSFLSKSVAGGSRDPQIQAQVSLMGWRRTGLQSGHQSTWLWEPDCPSRPGHLRRDMTCTQYRDWYLFLFFWNLAMLGICCGMWDLVPWPGIKPGSPALGAQSHSPWITGEVSGTGILNDHVY